MKILKFGMVAVMCCLVACAALADDAASGREIVSKQGAAVVKLQLVVKFGMSFGGRGGSKEEMKLEATGTFVDARGLLVTALSSIDPQSMMEGMMPPMPGGGGEPGMTSEVADLKIRLADGTEIPGKIVLRDKDLDLAFIRPSKKLDNPVPAADLKNSAEARILDRVLMLDRLGKAANRTLCASLDRIQAVVDKPRRFYVVYGGAEGGAPVFAMDGKLIGILALRTMPRQPGSSMFSSDNMMQVVVTCEDIATAAAQAPEDAPKQPEKQPEPPKPKVKTDK